MKIIGCIVKYVPCSVYGRLGSSCPYFVKGVRRCGYGLGECRDPCYDLWFRKVLCGEVKAYFPFHIRLLDEDNGFLLVYHTHRGGIVGEAKIVRHTIEGNRHYYWFDEFVVYPRPVPLVMVYSDERLRKLRGRWLYVYISLETLEEIRELAGLKGDLRLRLKREAELAQVLLKKVLRRKYAYRRLSASQVVEEFRDFIVSSFNEDIYSEVKSIFLDFVKRKVFRGVSYRVLFVGCLYLVLRKHGIPVDVKWLTEKTKVDLRKLYRIYSELVRFTGVKLSPAKPEDFILLKADSLNMRKEEIEQALSIVSRVRSLGLIWGKNPRTVAAAAVYLALRNKGIFQKEVAKVFGVSEVSLRNFAKLASASL